MKSAYEIAMGRLEKESPSVPLTEAQRAVLAEIDQECLAKIAEKKIFLEGEMRKAAGDYAIREQLSKQLASEIARLEEEREAKKERIRSGS